MTKEDVLKLVEAMAAVNGHPEPEAYAQAVAEAIEAKAAEKPAKKKEK